MKVTFDYALYASGSSSFELDVQTLPRMGEYLRIHQSLLPDGLRYCQVDPPFEFEDFEDGEGLWLRVEVVNIEHTFAKDGSQQISIWIEHTSDDE
jgi:hypothetical protein